jgi:hypothetical protein
MTTFRGRVILGFLLAPLVAPAVFLSLALVEDNIYGMPPGSSVYGEVLVALFVVMPPTYLAALVIGLPAYLVLTRYTTLRLWHTLAFAALVAVVFFPATGAPLRRLLFLGSPTMACALTLWLFLRETGPREKREMART